MSSGHDESSWWRAKEVSRLITLAERRFYIEKLDSTPTLVGLLSDRRIVANRAFRRVFAAPGPDGKDHTLDDVFPSDHPDLKGLRAVIDKMLQGGRTQIKSYLKYKGGRYRVSLVAQGDEIVLWLEDLVRAKIMLVNGDDDTYNILLLENYDVLRARNAMSALIEAEDHAGPIHLWLIDVTRPNLDEEERDELVGLAAFCGTKAKVLFITKPERPLSTPFPTLDKPFLGPKLLERIQELLQ